ncbi:MAG: ribosomal L7Ae/L30e/S12e/Gadd45 family protein [Firmicutes bacterium]|nr:ribosomal L7Ae/L30e/S12e/Gadd45 family protein [Bacillota bacterium]
MPDFGSLLGLAARAGELVSGEDICMREIRSQRARLVVLATDAGANGAKKIRDKCAFYGVPLVVALDRTVLGQVIGKGDRTVVAITSTAFAEMIKKVTGDAQAHAGGQGRSGGDGI